MARKAKGHHKGRGDPLKGSSLNRLSFYQARPINRDTMRVVEPQDSTRKGVAKSGKRVIGVTTGRTSKSGYSVGKQFGRRQVYKVDGTIVPVEPRKADF